ncbi:hypothetical protein [Streptacidiphilus monticola]|uniref:DUF1049 domain-containing protein n=1 Tax=Streptacidiphilus monticola TaxID=2161674 RepID=A0ABW1FZL3_9ACTN
MTKHQGMTEHGTGQPRTAQHRHHHPDLERHRFDAFSLIAGAVFVLVAVVYLLQSAGVLHVSPRLVVPVELIGLGAGGLAGVIRQRSRRRADRAARTDVNQASADR